jgi:peptidoglycan/LPS O-acetylase OafA/YrhL
VNVDVQLVESEAAELRSKLFKKAPAEFPLASTLLARRMPGIDVLRGCAVLMVVLFHGMAYQAPRVEWGSRFGDALYGLTAWGWLGVNLFFVISGFLITGILDDTVLRKDFYKQFYVRRALRILPAYLAVLALAWATGFITPNYVVVSLLFLSNMPGLFLRHGYLFYGPFWSLAVEEQFYLVWPMLYRRLGRRGMLAASLGLIALCPMLRALAFAGLLHTGDVLSKMWMIADNLAIGALLAVLLRWPGFSLRRFLGFGLAMGAFGPAALVALFAAHRMGAQDVLRNSVGLSCFQLVCGSVVVMALWMFRVRGLPGWMKIFVFFGDISYGLYLIHLLLLQIYDRAFGDGFKNDWRLLLMRFVMANGVAIVVAVVSKRYFEDPILRLKSRLEVGSLVWMPDGAAGRMPPVPQWNAYERMTVLLPIGMRGTESAGGDETQEQGRVYDLGGGRDVRDPSSNAKAV